MEGGQNQEINARASSISNQSSFRMSIFDSGRSPLVEKNNPFDDIYSDDTYEPSPEARKKESAIYIKEYQDRYSETDSFKTITYKLTKNSKPKGLIVVFYGNNDKISHTFFQLTTLPFEVCAVNMTKCESELEEAIAFLRFIYDVKVPLILIGIQKSQLIFDILSETSLKPEGLILISPEFTKPDYMSKLSIPFMIFAGKSGEWKQLRDTFSKNQYKVKGIKFWNAKNESLLQDFPSKELDLDLIDWIRELDSKKF
jgi:hypothetical protein